MIDYCPRKIVGLPVLAELGHGVFILVFGNSLCAISPSLVLTFYYMNLELIKYKYKAYFIVYVAKTHVCLQIMENNNQINTILRKLNKYTM